MKYCWDNLKIQSLKSLNAMLAHLPDGKRADLIALIEDHVFLFSNVPSLTAWLEHDIDVERFYYVPPNNRKHINAIIWYILDHDIARPSFSSWVSTCLLVNKPGGDYRFCTDYRKVNKVKGCKIC